MNPQKAIVAAALLVFASELGAACNASLPPSTPDSAFTIGTDGTVTHKRNGLIWMRCAMGKTWDGSTCTGTAPQYIWRQALQAVRNFNAAGGYAGHSDWRMPNIKELNSIVERQCYGPSINSNVFPNTEATSRFWSSTPSALGAAMAWMIGFYYGDVESSIMNTLFQVRLVRGGQSFDNPALAGSATSTTAPTTTTTTGATTTTSTAATTTTTSTTTTTTATSTTTSTAIVTTTTASTTSTTLGGSATLNLVAGWNLAGNSSSAALDTAAAFGDAAKVNTVWKWVSSGSKWAFYTPSLSDGGAVYAAGKGYDFLSSVAGGEGFWVNAKTAFTALLPSGTAITSAAFQSMGPGWSLIAIGDGKTPSAFNTSIGLTPPVAGDIPINLTTLWAWDAGLANWYFYAPTLDKSGGLSNYITSKGYLDFGTRVLDPTTGFWVNKP